MKTIISLTVVLTLSVVSCKKEFQPVPQNSDSIIVHDSTVSGSLPVTPDSLDNTLPVDSTAYNVDSIKNSK